MKAGAVGLILALGAILATDGAPSVASQSPRVKVATTGNHSERVRTIPITRERASGKRVVMSMKPRELPDLRSGDRVKVTAEAQYTVNCLYRSPRCVGPPYAYNPIIDMSLVPAKGKRTTGGKNTMRISGTKREICRQKLPAREHHCLATFTSAGSGVRDRRDLPCRPRSCRINLVASAHNRRASGRDLLMVGGLHPNGSIPQDRGRINAIRFRPAKQPRVDPLTDRTPTKKRVRSKHRRRVIYSIRLDDLRAGEQLEVSATLKTRIASLPYDVRHSAQLVLARSPRAGHTSDKVRPVAGLGGEIDELNLFNCTRNRPRCVMRKVGIARIVRDPDEPLFVNLYTVFSPKRHPARPGDRVKILRGGGLRVVRYPAELRG